MTSQPEKELASLRMIGWTLWDPIGLAAMGGPYPIDEYDRYLVTALERLRQGVPDQDVAETLAAVEAQNMGLGIRPDTRARARATVDAIRARFLP